MHLELAFILLLALLCSAATTQPAETEEPGVTLRVYRVEKPLKTLRPLAENQTPNLDELKPTLDLHESDFGAEAAPLVGGVSGTLRVEKPGRYAFELTCSGGATFEIAGNPVEKAADLKAGAIEFSLEFFLNDLHDARLRLRWKPPGASQFADIPSSALRTEARVTRVTAPGLKSLKAQRRPGDRCALQGVHPGCDLATIAPPGFEAKVGAMAFLPDGRLAVGTFSPLQRDEASLPDIDSKQPDKLYALTGVGGDPEKVTVRVLADGLYEPLGLAAVGNALYVSQRLEVTKLTDPDGDGFFDHHERVAGGWEGWNYHEFTFGLVHEGGKLYASLSTPMAPPRWKGMRDNSAPGGLLRGGVMEIDLATGTTTFLAGGLRTPNGLGVGPGGTLFVADNQGTWMPTSQFDALLPGHFYGHYNNTNVVENLAERFPDGGFPSMYADLPRTPPAVYLPHNELSNSPTQSLLVPDGPFRGQMLLGELTAGGVRRVFLEKVNGAFQGAVFRFTQGLSVGINRMAWGPDGALYVGGLGAGGNWKWRNTKEGLQRLTPNGKTAFEMLAVRATPDGFEIEFTKPVAPAFLSDPKHFQADWWTYHPTMRYGGPKVDQRTLTVEKAEPSADGRRVRLTIPDAPLGGVVHLVTDPTSVDGSKMWSTEAWYTLNAKPLPKPVENISLGGDSLDPGPTGVGAQAPADAVQLIGQEAETQFVRFKGGKLTYPQPRNRTQDELMKLSGEATVPSDLGDLVSRGQFADARLHVEWLSPPGGTGQLAGNSGVYLQGRYEIQVLGTPAGPTPPADNEAGAIYKVKPADVNASTGPGTWQSYDLWFRAPQFEGGKKVAEARVSVLWNGRPVHGDVPIAGPTGGGGAPAEAAPDGGTGPQIGPLRLQAHATAADGPVRFRNVWIAPLSPPTETLGPWVDLFDGKTLAGWHPLGGKAEFHAENGEIVGTARPDTPNTFLVTDRSYGDFDLQFEVMLDPALNSGVQIRSAAVPNATQRDARVTGLQIELDPGRRAWTGGLYDEAGRGWLCPLSTNPAARRALLPGQWNRLRVVARGPVIRTYLNGVPAARLFDATRSSGLIGLQVHSVGAHGKPLEVWWRALKIRVPKN